MNKEAIIKEYLEEKLKETNRHGVDIAPIDNYDYVDTAAVNY